MEDEKDVLFQVTYGSKLYGTNTPTSDTDLKSVYLPAIAHMLLGRRLVATKSRVFADGSPVPSKDPMPENGVENEFIPFQTFVRDFVRGQTYAVEVAFAIVSAGPQAHDAVSLREYALVFEMVQKFTNSEVSPMVGFAMKQTFDYVRRGERLNEALKVKHELEGMLWFASQYYESTAPELRLDTKWGDAFVLDHLAAETGLDIGLSANEHKVQRTLELNGRSYLESTRVDHVLAQVQKLVDGYGERSTKASEVKMDFKSLSHAIRVYEQAIELLQDGVVTFPRQNAEYLLRVKKGEVGLEELRSRLQYLDDTVAVEMTQTKLQKRTPELEAEAERWLLTALGELYLLA